MAGNVAWLGSWRLPWISTSTRQRHTASPCTKSSRWWMIKGVMCCGKSGRIIEGSLEVKLPTIWTDEKQSREEAERRERVEERRSEKRKSQKKADADARKGRKVPKHWVFPMIWGSGGSKSRLAKAAGAETSGEMTDEKLHAVVARSRFRSEKIQNTSAPDHFWKLRCWKSARRCGTKHIWKSKCVKNWGVSEQFWKLRCWKSARRCGAKHIWKSKCVKNTRGSEQFWKLRMTKKCTALWREAHLEVKSVKNWRSRSSFGSWDVEKVHAVVARSTFRSQNVKNTRGWDHFWRFITLHYAPLHYTTLHYTTLHSTTLQLQRHNDTTTLTLHHNYTTTTATTTQLHSTTLNYTTLHFTTLHYTTLHDTTLPSTTLHYITLHYTPLQLQLHNYTPLH